MSLQAVRPKILGFISEDASAWIVAALAFAAGILLTALLALATHELYQRQLRQRFELLANERFSRIEERFEDQVQRLEGLRRFFVFSADVTRSEFDGYVRPLLGRTLAYSWAPRIKGGERSAFEQSEREQGVANFSIREASTADQLIAASPRDEYLPVLYSLSLSALERPLGFDLLSDPARRAAVVKAAAADSMTVTTPIDLVGLEPDYSRGVLILAPVFAPGTSVLKGFVMAVVSMRQLMSEGLPATAPDNLEVRILDLSAPGEHEVLFESNADDDVAKLSASQLVRMADHSYRLDIRPSAVFMQANHSSAANVVVLFGGLLSLLLSTLLYNLVSQRQRALTLVEQRTAELRASEQELRGTHGQLRSVLNAATQVAIIATNLRGVVSTFNAGAELMLGYRSEEVVGRLMLEDLILHEELQARATVLSQRYGREIPVAQAMLAETIEDGGRQPRDWTLVRKNGTHLTANMLATAVLDEHGLWVGHLAICIDVTERKRVYEALAARDRLLEKLTAEVPGGIYQFQLNPDGSSCFTYASEGLRDIYEIDLEHLRRDATAIFERIHPEDIAQVRSSIRDSATFLTPWREEYRVQLPRRGLRWVRGEATPELLPDGGTLWHGYLTDISDLKRVEEELRALSITDSLTGIHNRRYFQERLKTELDRAHREHLDLAVIMLDIDHFKRINDQYGHAMGDHVLKSLCQRISQRLRRSDVFCRLGGEEFMVLCPGSNAEQAHSLAMELWQGLRGVPVEGVGYVTASFGVAGWRRGEGGDALLLRADSGVYAAKQGGRDRVEWELL